jgi:hypothetical protein
MDKNELPLEPHHLAVPSGASKMISDPMVRSTQIVHLSRTDSNSVSNRTKTKFHMTHVTQKFRRVHPKQLPSQWYIRRKPCTYLALRLALSQNGIK